MGRKSQTKTLYVFLNQLAVGELVKSPSGEISFKYHEDWLEKGFAISQSLPLQEQMFRGEVVSRYFDNLLPDNDDIKQIVAQKFGAESTRAFDMLEVIGKDCVGALSFLNQPSTEFSSFDMDYTPIDNAEIARRLRGLGSSTPLGMDEDFFRISLAGAQEKTAFLNIEGKWYEPHGLTPTTHIFKSPIGALGEEINFSDSVDNEWASLRILGKFGLNVCEAKIEVFEDQRVLVVKRFDRIWRQYQGKDILIRRPQEDLCQALGHSPYRKYQNQGGPGIEEISKLLRASINKEDRVNFFKAIIVFDLLYATDGHAKNFSLFMSDQGFKLTPFYDVMSGYFLHAREKRPLQKLKLAMKVGESGHYDFKRIKRRHYLETAKRCGISEGKFYELLEDLHELYKNLRFTEAEIDPLLDKASLDMILSGMEHRAKLIFNND